MKAFAEKFSTVANIIKKTLLSSRQPQRMMRRSIVYSLSALLAVFCLIYLQMVWAGQYFKTIPDGSSSIATFSGEENVYLPVSETIRATSANAGNEAWSSNGPYGGQIGQIAIDPNQLATVYATVENGLYRSTNSGATWQKLGLPYIPYFLAIVPGNPSIVYAATFSNGIYKSTNGGATWDKLGFPDRAYIYNVVVAPTNSSVIYVGSAYGYIYKSTDGGANWNAGNIGVNNASVGAIAVDPSNSNIVYAGISTPNDEYKVYKSPNGGGNWSVSSTGLPNLGIRSIVIDPTKPNNIYVGTQGGVYKSANSAASWAATGLVGDITLLNRMIQCLVISASNPSVLYAGTAAGIFKTVDGGTNWVEVSNGLNHSVGIRSLVIHPSNPDIAYAGTGDGVYKSVNGGTNWSASNTGLVKQSIYAFAIAKNFQGSGGQGVIYAGAVHGVYGSTDGGASWNLLGANSPFEVIALAVDPRNSNVIYAGTRTSGLYKSVDGGSYWYGLGLPNPSVRALTIDTVNPDTIYAGTTYAGNAGVYKSTDGGNSWNQINTGLTNTIVISITLNPSNSSIIYAGTSGGVFKSINGGNNWSQTSLTNVNIYGLAIDQNNPSIIYAGTVGNGVYKSINGGATWTESNNGLTNNRIYSLGIDPINTGTIYAGSDGSGVFRSTDGGANWSGFNSGFGPGPHVFALAINQSGRFLYAGVEADNGGAFSYVYAGVGCTLNCTATVSNAGIVGTPVSFAATATPITGCTGSPAYDWDFGDGSSHSSQQSSAHTYVAIGDYTWKLAVSVNGTLLCAQSGVVAVKACVMPNITLIATQPTDPIIIGGQTAILTVLASGSSPLRYQWYQDNGNGTWQPVGIDSNTLFTSSLNKTTIFWVRVSNNCGSKDSSQVTISVIPLKERPREGTLYGSIDTSRPTIVLTHGLEDIADYNGAPNSLWIGGQFGEAGSLIAEATKGKDRGVNILQYVWEGAFQGYLCTNLKSSTIGPCRADYVDARSHAVNAGLFLGGELLKKLGPNYKNKIHFIGHSLGTVVNTYAASFFLKNAPLVTEAQFTALDRPQHVNKIPNGPSTPFYSGDDFQRIYGFNQDFFAAQFNNLRRPPALRLVVDNYYAADGDSTLSGAGVGDVTNPIDGLTFYNHPKLIEPNDVNEIFKEGRIGNNHSGVQQWYRLTINPNFNSRPDSPICRGSLFNRPFLWDQSLNPCEKGWYWSLNGTAPFPPPPSFDPSSIVKFRDTLLKLTNFVNIHGCNLSNAILPLFGSGPKINCKEGSSSFAAATIEIPLGTEYLSFDYLFSNIGDGDYAAVFIDDHEIWRVAAASFVGKEFLNSGPIPASGFIGSHRLTIALYGVGVPNAEIQIQNIVGSAANHAPILIVPTAQKVALGSTIVFKATATDADGDTLTYNLIGAPSGTSVNSATGEFKWTPASGQIGTHTFKIRVTDNGTPSLFAEQIAEITVEPPCTSPSITAQPANQAIAVGAMASFTAAAMGNPSPAAKWQVALNGSSTFSDIPGAASATLNFAASAADNGKKYRTVFSNSCGAAISNAATLTLVTTPLLVSEFRFYGPGGSGDWFVELYNNTDAPLSTTGRQLGIINTTGSTSFAVNLPANGVIPARGNYLIAGPNYSLLGLAVPDLQVMELPFTSVGGVGIFNGAINNPANRLDSVAYNSVTANASFAYFREGTALASLGNTMAEHSWLRKLADGLPQDTNNNQADFVLLSLTGGAINGVAAMLGLPGPQSSTSPMQSNDKVPSLMLDPNASSTSPPNRERSTTPVLNGAQGTLTLRRKFTNNTGVPIKKLRFRIVDITNSPTGSEAELRALSSVDVMINGQLVRGVTLEQPPAQPNGGGLNSTLAVGSVTLANSLPAGASINVQFLLGVQRSGGFRFFVNVEALP